MVLQTPQGWTLSFDCSTYPEDHWGLLLPQLRKLLQRWPALSAAAAAAQNHKLRQQVVVSSRKGSDSALSALAARTAAQTPAQPAPGAAKSADGDADADAADADAETAAGPAGEGDGLVGAAAAPADGGSMAAAAATAVTASVPVPAAAAGLDRLVLELGWETFKPRQLLDDEEGEEEEEPVVEFALAIYNLQVSQAGVLTERPTAADASTALDARSCWSWLHCCSTGRQSSQGTYMCKGELLQPHAPMHTMCTVKPVTTRNRCPAYSLLSLIVICVG